MAKQKSTRTAPQHLPVLVNAEHLISQRLDEMLAFEPYLTNPDNVYELHEMRIAAKRLRYTMEIFQDVYTLYTGVGPEFGKALKAVKALQEHLGVLHDADVLVPQLLEHMARVLHTGYGPQTSAPISAQNAKSAPAKSNSALKGNPSAKTSKEIEALPIAGVHRVDYLACQGLLNLCTKTRSDRDARYAQLVQDWQRLKNELLFDRLRQLIATSKETSTETSKETSKEISKETPMVSSKEEEDSDKKSPLSAGIPAVSEPENVSGSIADAGHSEPVALPLTAPNDRPEDTENVEDVSTRKNSQVQRAPGEPGHVAAARRRVPASPGAVPPDGARKGKEGRGTEERRGKREEGRDTTQSPKPGNPTPKSAAAHSAGRNGSARATRHSGPGTDTDTGAGEGGTK